MKRKLNLWALSLFFMLYFGGFFSVSAKSHPPPAKIVSGLVSNVASMLWKWLWSLHSSTTSISTSKSGAVSSRSMVKYESGYNIETVFDGSKFGIEPFAIEISPNGQLLVLDSENSNLHRISMPLSTYGRPKLVLGSTEGITGHVDGKLKEARMNHPKGLTIDERGNIYIADTNNMAIRKISDDGGVSTIAGGGRRGRGSGGGGHVDGPAEDAKFSDDFDLVYISESCSLLVIDRGNQAIREIQLYPDDCSQEQDKDIHLGTVLLLFAVFFGYMLALLQRRVQRLFSSSRNDKRYMVMAPYQRYSTPVRPAFIRHEHEPDKPDEGFFGSLGKLVVKTGSSVSELFSGTQRIPQNLQYYHQQEPNQWPVQDSFVIPEGDEPPGLEPRTGIADKTYLRTQASNQNRPYYQQKQNVNNTTSDEKNEIMFGAVQEQEGRREAMVIKAVDFSEPMNDQRNLRPRINYMGYSSHAY